MRNLQVDEFLRTEEFNLGAVGKLGGFALFEVDAGFLSQLTRVHQVAVEGEQPLRATGVQARVAAVDVDSHGRVLHRRVGGLQQRTLFTSELGSRGEQALDCNLVLAALEQVRVHARWWVETQSTRGQEEGRVIRAELDNRGTRLTIRPGHLKGRGKAVPLQVHTVTGDAQRVVDLQRGLLPLIDRLTHILFFCESDVRGEHLGLAVRQVIGSKVLDLNTERVQSRTVEGVARAQRVIVRRSGVTKRNAHRAVDIVIRNLSAGVGQQNDLALVINHAPQADDDNQQRNAQVEHQVAELTQVALLRGKGARPSAIFICWGFGQRPLVQALTHPLRNFVRGSIDHGFVVKRKTRQPLRCPSRWRLHGLVVVDGPRNNAADQGNQQQGHDGDEPDGRENIEKLQLIHDLGGLAVGGKILVDLVLIQRALRQQGTRNRCESEDEQQNQRRAHAGQPVPDLLEGLSYLIPIHRHRRILSLNWRYRISNKSSLNPGNKNIPQSSNQGNSH